MHFFLHSNALIFKEKVIFGWRPPSQKEIYSQCKSKNLFYKWQKAKTNKNPNFNQTYFVFSELVLQLGNLSVFIKVS